jgi:hypothetical protein
MYSRIRALGPLLVASCTAPDAVPDGDPTTPESGLLPTLHKDRPYLGIDGDEEPVAGDGSDGGGPLDPVEVGNTTVTGPLGFAIGVLSVGDADGDGRSDLLAVQDDHPFESSDAYAGPSFSDEPGSLWLLSSARSGAREEAAIASWREPAVQIAGLAAARDVDGGGAADFWVLAPGELRLVRGESRGDAIADDALAVVALDCSWCAIHALPDVDGDGLLDLGFSHVSGAFVISGALRGNHGSEAFRSEVRLATGGALGLRDAGDLDGDGRSDVVATGGAGSWWLPDVPAGELVLEDPDRTEPGPVAAVGDVDGDGHDDVAFGGCVVRGGPHGFAEGPPDCLAGAERLVGLGDLDGDGAADLAAIRGSEIAVAEAPLALISFEAAARFDLERTSSEGPISPIDLGVAAVGDVDGDCIPEVAISAAGETYLADPGAYAARGPGWVSIVSGAQLR